MVNMPADGKIVRPPSTVFTGEPQVCKACGLPRQTRSFCRGCAFLLIDVALSSCCEIDGRTEEEFLGGAEPSTKAPQSCYDHYEICLRADGTPWELGRGSMGITYKATDSRLGRPVALKIISSRCLDSSGAKERFLREARTTANLRHPNIASVFHLGSGEEDCYYAMEYIEGETLDACIRRTGAFGLPKALQVTAQIARALGAAHAQNFIHRDIKPSNIMLVDGANPFGEEVMVKLIDFGLVKAVENLVATDPVDRLYFAGTPIYASPEQRDFGRVDARSDIFSLGQCLRYMLTGHCPQSSFLEAEDAALALVAPLLQKMTEWNPNLRPQTAAELSSELRTWTNLLCDDPGKRQADYKGGAGRTCKAAVAVLVLMVTLALGTSYAWSVRREKIAAGVRAARLEATTLCAEGDEFRCKFTETDNRQAIELYSRAIARFPSLADAHADLALAYCQQVARFGAPGNVLDAAVRSAQKAIAVDSGSSKGYEALGVIRSQQGHHWEALSQLRRALEVNSRDVQAMRYFSTLWEFVGQPQMGLPWAKEVVKAEPANKRGWDVAADISVDLCADEDAERYYRRCLEIDPRMMAAYRGLLHIHLLEGNFALAREDYTLAESIEPGTIHTLTLKAQIDLFSGDYVTAEATYRRLLQMDRKGLITYYSSISYLSALGFLRLQAGDLPQADLFLEQATQMHSESTDNEGPQAIYDLAAIRAIQGRKSDALIFLERAICSGWIDFRATGLDPRFQSLREDPRFVQMLEGLSVRVKQMRDESGLRCAKTVMIEDYPIHAADW